MASMKSRKSIRTIFQNRLLAGRAFAESRIRAFLGPTRQRVGYPGLWPISCSVPAVRPRLGQSSLSERPGQARRLNGSESLLGKNTQTKQRGKQPSGIDAARSSNCYASVAISPKSMHRLKDL